MKKISEMTQAELQDYALSLEEEKASLKSQLETSKNESDELRKTNLMLQERNNKLFMQVEQSATSTASGDDPEEEEPEEVESCEDFAIKNFKEIMNK